MGFKNLTILAFQVSLLLSFLSSLSIANNYAESIVPIETICNYTLYPSYCQTILANQNGTTFEYCNISIRKSLSRSRMFLNLVYSYFQGLSSFSQITIRALEDCQFLSELNYEYLSNTYNVIEKSGNVLTTSQIEDFHTFLSAILTNQQTCLDSLQTSTSDSRVKNDLYSSLYNDMKLNSVSLALFKEAWVLENKNSTSSWENHTSQSNFQNQVRGIYDSSKGNGRKLLQTMDDSESIVVKDTVVVSKDGSGNFTTINDAIDAAPNNTVASDGYFIIFITQGIYQEYVSIAKNKKFLMLIGDGINKTIITGDHNVVDGFTTFNSATFAVVAQGFVAVNITFENSAGASKHQAVAVRNGADMSTFYSCSFEGYQDTLYTHSLRQFYRECNIYGTVDFIFGNAAVVLQSCNLYPRLPMTQQFNAITAQGRSDPNQNTGISIQNATIKPSNDLAPMVSTVKTYLGRPWKEYSRTVYMECFMDNFIAPEGWHEWNADFALNTSYYGEYNNIGPGSNIANRVTWLGYHVINANDALNFTVLTFLDGHFWLPQTSVPFQLSL
ncbi:hypothetical protein Lal_00004199 [Lupinus albus]|uniref:Pectinesterase n=1 Tax=Lupinus albus TaxID=3870 RepID=A0A6A4NXC1_LUPAL|nr:putative pectinesterase [Lupinus albus]KAE9598237.1 putative pectinesterase [Lupinus albus]KAF1894144.1 hypothetical protein Lal_00004063 [Lupinus albus]KAF1894275.1 hypothetical protein Lal_00004199 [Lupinus albus]